MNNNDIKNFCKDIVSKKAYYLTILLFSVVAYSFSMLNRTVSWDDMLQDHYVGSGQIALAGRWGMLFLMKLFGVVDLNPFVTRFMALVFLILAATVLCYFFYVGSRSKNVLGYAIFASIFVTYPLVNEIWEYHGANFLMALGCFLATLAAGVIRHDMSNMKKMVLATALLILPVSSYESSAFFYATLVCVIVFYDTVVLGKRTKSLWKWFGLFIPYVLPLVFAIVIRYGVSFILCWIYDLTPVTGGDTEIMWFSGSIGSVLMSFVKSNIMQYVFASLIYLPITEFLIAAIIFAAFAVGYSVRQKRVYPIIMAGIVFLSVFLLAILKGSVLSYRNTLTVTLFVAVVAYMVYRYFENKGKKSLIWICSIFLLFVCWHQSVFLNNTFALNNQRSDNELAVLHGIGQRLTCDYEKKPVVFVSPCNQGEWIRDRIHVNPKTWNGKLYNSLLMHVVSDPSSFDVTTHNIYETNVTIVTKEYNGLRELFTYLGYDIDVVGPVEKPYTEEHRNRDLSLLKEATQIAKDNNMKPFQILDAGAYLIVMLGDEEFMIESFQ